MDPRRSKRRGRTPSGAAAATGTIQALTRGLTLLERLAESEGSVSLTDLAQQVGLAPSTTHRLLTTLERLGYVQQVGELGLWSVGVKAFTVGNAFLANRDLTTQAHLFLRRLMEQSGETTNLAVPDDGEAVFVAQVECREMMRMLARIGSRAPLHASGVGKAMLSAMPAAAVSEVLHKHGLPRYTPYTLDSPGKLRSALEAVRKRGYAIDDEEHALGLRCVAAPIYDEHSELLAAISVSGPKPRIPDERLLELGVLVTRAAEEITRAFGGRMPR